MAKAKKKEKTIEEKKEEIIQKSLEIIEKKNIVFIRELCAYLPIGKSTFYEWDLDKSDVLRDAIDNSKVCRKASLRSNWEASDNATLQLASYRLMSEPDEHKKLNQNYTDITTDGDKILPYDMNEKDRAQKVAELRGELNSD